MPVHSEPLHTYGGNLRKRSQKNVCIVWLFYVYMSWYSPTLLWTARKTPFAYINDYKALDVGCSRDSIHDKDEEECRECHSLMNTDRYVGRLWCICHATNSTLWIIIEWFNPAKYFNLMISRRTRSNAFSRSKRTISLKFLYEQCSECSFIVLCKFRLIGSNFNDVTNIFIMISNQIFLWYLLEVFPLLARFNSTPILMILPPSNFFYIFIYK